MNYRRGICLALISTIGIEACGAAERVTELQDATFVSIDAAPVVRTTGASGNTILWNPTEISLTQGSSTQFSARVVDRGGRTIRSATIAWTSSDNSVLSINPSGLALATNPGTAIVAASFGGATKRIAVTVRGGALQIRISPRSLSLSVGLQSIISISASRDGQTVSSSDCTLQTQGAAVSTLHRTVTAIAVGTAFVISSCGGARDSIPVTVSRQEIVPPAPVQGVAELPRSTPERSLPVATRSVVVPASANLQTYLDAAQAGDELLLPSGASFTGNFILPAKPGSGWITIRTHSAALPGPGTRTSPQYSGQLAKLITPNFNPALATAPSAARYALVNVELTTVPTVAQVSRIVDLGDGSVSQNSLTLIPNRLILDRVYVHAGATQNVRRCISLQSGPTAIIDSYISECHNTGFDAQAIGGWNGSGPYLIENNYVEASGEVLLIGGSDIGTTNLVPSDITIRRNHVTRPDSWKGRWLVKNLIEFKSGQRILIEGNVVERNWIDGQSGWGLVITPDKPDLSPWNTVSDITVRSNIFRKMGTWLLTGAWNTSPPARMLFQNNLVYEINTGPYTGGGFGYITSFASTRVEFISNTILVPGTTFQIATSGFVGLVIRNNILGSNGGDALFSSSGIGTSGLNAVATSWTFEGNGLLGIWADSFSRYPLGSRYAANLPSPFVNAATGNFRVLPASTFNTGSTTGGSSGVDMNVLEQLTGGVVITP